MAWQIRADSPGETAITLRVAAANASALGIFLDGAECWLRACAGRRVMVQAEPFIQRQGDIETGIIKGQHQLDFFQPRISRKARRPIRQPEIKRILRVGSPI